MVPWYARLVLLARLMMLVLFLSSCSVLVESEAFRTLTAPTNLPPVSTSRASPEPSDPFPSATPGARGDDDAPMPVGWVRDLAWAHLLETGVADGATEPVWDDSCGPASSCWGAWRLQIRRLPADAETDRFGVTAVGAGGLIAEMVVASDATVTTQTLIIATPRPMPRPSPSPSAQSSIYVVTVHSLPAGSVHDDMVRIWSGDLGQMGVRGADEELEQAVEAQRDTGRLLRVRAWHEGDVADYGGARLVIEGIIEEGPLPEGQAGGDEVEGWIGTVVPLPEAATYDDYFDSRWPGGQYGITADDALLAEALVRLRDSGQVVRVWGLLRENDEDYGETQIVVSRIELADIEAEGE